MLGEITSAVVAAGRVGYQVGLQMQVDRVINDWAQYARCYKDQRDEAWDEIRSVKAQRNEAWDEVRALKGKLAAVQEERRVLQAKLKSSETQVKDLRANAGTLERKNANLSVEVGNLAKWKEDMWSAIKRDIQQSETSKEIEEGERKKLVEKLNLQSQRLTATWARLTGAERVFGRLVSEL